MPNQIQSFYNGLLSPKKKEKAVSPKTAKNTHGVLHKTLQQAVSNGYIRINPTDACVLPRVEKKQIQPLDEDQITEFLRAIKGHQYEDLFLVTLFTGMRESEALGLTWDCVNFENSTITINKRILYFGCIRTCNRPNETSQCSKNGAVYPLCESIRGTPRGTFLRRHSTDRIIPTFIPA